MKIATLEPRSDAGPRYIDPNAPITKQISVLDQLRKNPPENSRRVNISPELAEHILTHVTDSNRSRRPGTVRKYADDMAGGRWRLTGDTIKFGRSGLLRDGQHRLAACVRSGVRFETYVIFGVEDDAFIAMDIGANRKGNDTFTIASVPNASSASAAVRWHLIFTGGDPTDRSQTFSNRELLEAYQALDMDAFDSAVADAKNACRGQREVHESALAALVFMYRRKHAKAVAAFLADLKANKGSAKKLRTKLATLKKENLSRVHENQRNALLVITLNAYVAKEAITAADLKWTTAQDFPVFA